MQRAGVTDLFRDRIPRVGTRDDKMRVLGMLALITLFLLLAVAMSVFVHSYGLR